MEGKSKFVACLCLLLMTLSVDSKNIYTWTDENGVTHFSDIPVNSNKSEVAGKIHSTSKQSNGYYTTTDNDVKPMDKILEKRGNTYLCEGRLISRFDPAAYRLNNPINMANSHKHSLLAALSSHEREITRVKSKLSRLNNALKEQQKALSLSNDIEMRSAIESTKYDLNYAKCELLANEQYFTEFRKELEQLGS